MWIEIQDDIKEYLDTIDNALCQEAIAINTLIESMLKGQHIVYMSRIVLNKLIDLDYISPSNKMFINWVKQKYIYIYAGRDIIEHKIVITIKNFQISIEGNNYIVPLKYFYDFRETKLLTENETDGRFFEDICQFIKKDKNISDWYSIRFENDSCHGSNVASKIMQNALENRIALCILDSDKDMKNSKMGDTYKGANKSFKKIKKDHIIILKALESREKENLFPPIVYMLLCEEKKELLTTLNLFIDNQKIIKFFDLKDGVKYKKYKKKRWLQYYKPLIDEFIKVGIYKEPIDSEIKDDFICIEGIGDKLCDIVCQILLESELKSEELLEKRGVSEKNKRKIHEIRENFKNVLPCYMYDEWEQLYKLLFSWGCCIEKKKLPNYKM